jgi:VIT1/CCC1 family predicted Fe2+/Mn2+ transporter
MPSPSALMLNLFFSAIGAAYFIYGKKQSHFVALFSGLALMVVPYFIGNGYLLAAVCVVIMLAPKFFKL